MEHRFNDMCEMGYDSRLGLVLVVLTYMYMFVCSNIKIELYINK